MSKKKHKKGLLPSAVGRIGAKGADADSKPSKSKAQSATAVSATAGVSKTSKAAVKPRKLDPVTGKKKGTLFSAAPSAATAARPGRQRAQQRPPAKNEAAPPSRLKAAFTTSTSAPPSAHEPTDKSLHTQQGKAARKNHKRRRAPSKASVRPPAVATSPVQHSALA